MICGEQSRAAAQPLADALIRELRAAGAAGATALRGIWGFHGDHAPHGDTLCSSAGESRCSPRSTRRTG